MEITMYDNLLLLPLFQGLSKNNLTTIIEKVKFHFHTYEEGETIIRQGDDCRQLCFLMNGEVTAQITDPTHGFSITEVLEAPFNIELYSLYGMHTRYRATYTARTKVNLLTIDKDYIFQELSKYYIFRLNFLNILSNHCQNAQNKLWNTHIGSLSEKFIQFISLRSQTQTGEKTLLITMEDLANLISETRINVSRLLNQLQADGHLTLRRKGMVIHDFQKMVEALQNNETYQ